MIGMDMSLLAIAAIVVPFVAALAIVVSPQRAAKWWCVGAAAVSTALPKGRNTATNQLTTRICFMDMDILTSASDGPEYSAKGPSWISCSASAMS